MFSLVDRCKEMHIRPHLVIDAAFCTEESLIDLSERGWVATASCSSTTLPWLWSIMTTNLPPHTHRCSWNEKKDLTASVHTSIDKKNNTNYHLILTSGWFGTKSQIYEDNNIINCGSNLSSLLPVPDFNDAELKNMKVEELKEICKMYKIRRGKRKNDYVENILHRAKNQNRDFSVQNKVNHYFKNSQ